jgi:hypothetical protein
MTENLNKSNLSVLDSESNKSLFSNKEASLSNEKISEQNHSTLANLIHSVKSLNSDTKQEAKLLALRKWKSLLTLNIFASSYNLKRNNRSYDSEVNDCQRYIFI